MLKSVVQVLPHSSKHLKIMAICHLCYVVYIYCVILQHIL